MKTQTQTISRKTTTTTPAVETAPAIDWGAILDAHNGDMAGAMARAGFADAGDDTLAHLIQSAVTWAIRLHAVGQGHMMMELCRTTYAQTRKSRQPKPVELTEKSNYATETMNREDDDIGLLIGGGTKTMAFMAHTAESLGDSGVMVLSYELSGDADVGTGRKVVFDGVLVSDSTNTKSTS